MTQGNADERRSKRSRVMLTATIEAGKDHIPVRIDDLSAHGARVLGADLPPIDTPVTFRCRELAVDGYVAWVDEGSAGIGFGKAVEPERVMRKVSSAAPARRPSPDDFRRPGFRSGQLTPAEQRLIEQWAALPGLRPGD